MPILTRRWRGCHEFVNVRTGMVVTAGRPGPQLRGRVERRAVATARPHTRDEKARTAPGGFYSLDLYKHLLIYSVHERVRCSRRPGTATHPRTPGRWRAVGRGDQRGRAGGVRDHPAGGVAASAGA